jgi:hypothetical protein
MSLQRHTNQSGPAKTIAKKSKASTTVKKGCGRLTGRGLRFIPFGRFASEMPRDLVADGKAAPPSKEKLDKWLPLTAPLDWDYAGKVCVLLVTEFSLPFPISCISLSLSISPSVSPSVCRCVCRCV